MKGKKYLENNIRGGKWFFVLFLLLILATVFVIAPPNWVGYSGITYNATEGTLRNYTLSNNITGFSNDVTFAFDTAQANITVINSSGSFIFSPASLSSWIWIGSPNIGDLIINSSFNNQTGRLLIPIQAKNTTDNTTVGVSFTFDVYPQNDFPTFSNLNSSYTLTESTLFNQTINGLDEELHYPLNYNISFSSNCTHATWSNRTNCNLLEFNSLSNTSAFLNLTPVHNDVGTYWANVTVTDWVSSCPHDYCNSTEYLVNRTTSEMVVFNTLSTLSVNVTDCTGLTLTENIFFSCLVNITTQGAVDNLNLYTVASFYDGYGGAISNYSWFYPNSTTASGNFSKSINVSFTPTDIDVGNWSISFNVNDTTLLESGSGTILIYVNNTEDAVSLDSISDYTLYDNSNFTVNAIDPDLMIQDKDVRDEVLTFVSNTSWITFGDSTPSQVSGNNYSTATVILNYSVISSSGDANYSVKINVTDVIGNSAERSFVVQILSDSSAEWNSSANFVNYSIEGARVSINLTNGYVNDSEGDALTFSSVSSNSFSGFNLSGVGLINFTSTDVDVGYHNVTINASDGKLESLRSFNFTIYNVLDPPYFSSTIPTTTVAEDSEEDISLIMQDNDYLIPSGQSSFFSENLTINLTFTNLTTVESVISFDFDLVTQSGNQTTYLANFTPSQGNIGSYNVTVNVTDAGGLSNVTSFILNITETNDVPNISTIGNRSISVLEVFYLDINATDSEDSPSLPENGSLIYQLDNLTIGGNFLTINSTTGAINFTLNETYAGYWSYNVTVNDTDGANSSQIFTLTVYGTPNITLPSTDYVFNWTEGVSTGNITLNVSYAVNNTLLSYKLYLDEITYVNSSWLDYSTLISNNSLRNYTNHTWTNETNFTWEFIPNYTDETYGHLKNLTLVVFNPDYPDLNDSLNWKVNVSHTNQNLSLISGTGISDKGPVSRTTTIEVNLSHYFRDVDHFDAAYSQNVSYILNTVSGDGYIVLDSSINNATWILTLGSAVATSELLTVTGFEYNSSGILIGNVTSDSFYVNFTDPEDSGGEGSTSSGSSGGGSSSVKYISLRIIFPEEVVFVDPYGYIDTYFELKNDGAVSLRDIDLRSLVTFNNVEDPNVRVSLSETNVPILEPGKTSGRLGMRITANTRIPGKYKATVFGDVKFPPLSDYGEFFIEVRQLNGTEEVLIFTEKLVSENPQCLELKENVKEARKLFDEGDEKGTLELLEKITTACEEAIASNEQIRYPLSFVRDNFYYLSFATLTIFMIGFIFYVYKRVRFNKSRLDDYIEVNNGSRR